MQPSAATQKTLRQVADYPLTRAWLQSPEGDGWLAVRESLLGALALEHGANHVDTRERAQATALATAKASEEMLGITGLRQRRMLAALDDHPIGTKADEHDYIRRITEAVRDALPAGLARLCYALGRIVRDYDATLGGDLAKHMAGTFIQMAEGRHSVLEVDRQGVDKDTGAALMLHMGVISAAGYDAGVRYGRQRIPDMFWEEAATAHNAAARQLRRDGEICPYAGAQTIRGYCSRKRNKNGGKNKDREAFESARRQGMRAAARGLIDPSALLAAFENKARLVGTSTFRTLIGDASLANEMEENADGRSIDHTHIPGHRNLLRNISEATGALCLLQEILDDHGVERLVETLNLGLVLYEADGISFVPMAPFQLYVEMLDRMDDDDGDNADEATDSPEVVTPAAA